VVVAVSEIYTWTEAPVIRPHPYGLFSVAPPESPSDSQWESWACTEPGFTVDPCIDGSAPGAKQFDECGAISKFKPVTVYFGLKRSGPDATDINVKVDGTFEAAEEFGVEEHLWAEMLNHVGAPNIGVSPSLPEALATVEAGLARRYHGTGVIHMNRGTAVLLAPHLVREGGSLQTIAGTPVVAGAGYNQDLVDPTPGPAVIFGTGAVEVRRSAEVLTLDSWDTAINDHYVLAERTYVVGWDCYLIGQTATV
jgi:hypothetical protein